MTKPKAAALADAGLTDAVFTKAKLDYDDNRDVYDIEFYSGTIEYEYEISVYGGSIIKKDVEFTDSKNVADGQDIGLEAAKEAAVKDAGLNVNDISFTKAEKETDDGISVYEIEFIYGAAEYDYEINASTGSIIKKENKYTKEINDLDTVVNEIRQIYSVKDIALADAGVNAAMLPSQKQSLTETMAETFTTLNFTPPTANMSMKSMRSAAISLRENQREERKAPPPANTGSDIGIDEAKLVALKHCGLSAFDVTFTTVKKDRDDGVDCYELEFCTSEHEYEYEIHCYTGEILHNECHNHDRDDDDCGHNGRHH